MPGSIQLPQLILAIGECDVEPVNVDISFLTRDSHMSE